MRKFLLSMMAAFFLCGAFFIPSAAAEYPEKPISFIVPFPPGDLDDIITRMIAENMQKAYGLPAAVINKPGGGGGPFPGAIEVAKAPADGYTIGSFPIAVPVIGSKIGIPELADEPFEPLGIIFTYPFVIAASKDAPYKNMQELADYAKKKKVILGHFGDPLPPTKVTKAMAKKLGFAYASDAAFDALDCNTIASGDVDVMNTTLQLIMPCLDKMNVLATVTGKERIPLLPDTPTTAEIVPELKLALWQGLFVHKDTPADARKKIIAVAQKTMESDAVKALADKTGVVVYWKDVEAAKAQIKEDQNTFGVVNQLLK